MNTIETLRDRNLQFAAHGFRPGLPLAPALRTVVIGCVDPRVDPAHVLGLANGEAAVLRNVGGRVVPATLQALAMLTALARDEARVAGEDWSVVVLHHTDCGITRLAENTAMLCAYFGVRSEELAAKEVADPRASVTVDVAMLRANHDLPTTLSLFGLVYDVATGLVATVVPPAPARCQDTAK